MKALIFCMKLAMRLVYFFLKWLRPQNKIVMISRESNYKSIDFMLLEEEIHRRREPMEVVCLCKKMGESLEESVKYLPFMLRCMYHLATSKACIIDTYCIPVSVLKHRKKLVIVQIWHSLGAIKKFGHQALGTFEGRNKAIAHSLNMHQNYSYITCASHATKEFYSEAFNVPPERVLVQGMPRIDYILGNELSNYRSREAIYKRYPQLRTKKTILYLPTFRKGEQIQLQPLLDAVNFSDYNLLVKLHPLDSPEMAHGKAILTKMRTFDLFKVADYIVTDYSAAAIEACLMHKPLYFYIYDLEAYQEKRGLNMDLQQEMPSCTRRDFRSIMSMIESGNYNYGELHAFRNKYVETQDTNNTKRIVTYLYQLLELETSERKQAKAERISAVAVSQDTPLVQSPRL